MTRRLHIFVVAPLICLCAVFAPAQLVAQAVGADDYEAPDDPLPGEADTAPSTEIGDTAAVHPGTPSDSARQPSLEALEGDLTIEVRVTHANDGDIDLSGLPVTIEAVRPPGPMQPDNFRVVFETWDAVTDADGLAVVSGLPEGLETVGLALQASTNFGNLSFDTPYFTGQTEQPVELVVYDRTHELPPIKVSRKRVVISPWEKHLVFDQFWTFEIDGDYAVDLARLIDPEAERGVELRFPMVAKDLSFAGPGDHEVIDNRIYWSHVLVPGRPVTVQVRFSQSAPGSSHTFEQTVDFPIDEVQVLAAVDTPFDRVPRLDDLVLRAPGFEVGSDPSRLGIQARADYLVASGRSLEAGETYALRLDGLPFRNPRGGWIALFGGLLIALFVAGFGIREHRKFRSRHSRRALLDALRRRRDAVYDELAEIERQLEHVDDEDFAFELEEEQILLRQRLALILGKIDELDSAEDDSSQVA